jgi:plastocyanin
MPVLRLAILGLLLAVAPAWAEEPTFEISIRDHRFEPARIEIPANQKVRLVVKNLDATAEEFESPDLKREKVIPGGRQAIIAIGPLVPGTYKFIGEYHEATAKGEIVAK